MSAHGLIVVKEITYAHAQCDHMQNREGGCETVYLRVAAEGELQRVAPRLLHLLPSPRRILRPQHVRGRRRRELPQVSREPGAGGEGSPRGHARQEDGAQAEKYGPTQPRSARFLSS